MHALDLWRGSRKGYFLVSFAGGLLVAGGAAVVTQLEAPSLAASATAPAPQGTGSAAGGGGASGGAGAAGGNGSGSTANGKAFTISGSVTGLYPGGTRPLALAVDNPNPQAIRVETLTVRVADAGPQCPGTLVSAGAFTPFVVDARATGRTTIALHLAATAGNACRPATWTLTYSGTAVKA